MPKAEKEQETTGLPNISHPHDVVITSEGSLSRHVKVKLRDGQDLTHAIKSVSIKMEGGKQILADVALIPSQLDIEAKARLLPDYQFAHLILNPKTAEFVDGASYAILLERPVGWGDTGTCWAAGRYDAERDKFRLSVYGTENVFDRRQVLRAVLLEMPKEGQSE